MVHLVFTVIKTVGFIKIVNYPKTIYFIFLNIFLIRTNIKCLLFFVYTNG